MNNRSLKTTQGSLNYTEKRCSFKVVVACCTKHFLSFYCVLLEFHLRLLFNLMQINDFKAKTNTSVLKKNVKSEKSIFCDYDMKKTTSDSMSARHLSSCWFILSYWFLDRENLTTHFWHNLQNAENNNQPLTL